MLRGRLTTARDSYRFPYDVFTLLVMALKFFDSQPSSSGSLDFLDEWIKKNPKNKETVFPINEVKRAQSNKGYTVKTDKFMVFLWGNSKDCKNLLEALQFYCENPQDGCQLAVVLDDPKEPKYRLAVDDEKPVTWFVMGNGFTTTEPVYSLGEESSSFNPLLVNKGS